MVLEDFPLSPFLMKALSAFLLFICFLTSSLIDITMKKRLFEFLEYQDNGRKLHAKFHNPGCIVSCL